MWSASQPFDHGDLNHDDPGDLDHGHLYHDGVLDRLGVFFVTPCIASSKLKLIVNGRLFLSQTNEPMDKVILGRMQSEVIFYSRGPEHDLKTLILNYKSLELGS